METRLASDRLALADRLRHVLIRISLQLRREAEPLGLTAGQAALLNTIRLNPGYGVRDLAEAQGVSTPALSRYLDRLETAGFVTRSPAVHDARRRHLELTSTGETVLVRLRSRRTAWLASRLSLLSAPSAEAIAAALGPLEQLLEDD